MKVDLEKQFLAYLKVVKLDPQTLTEIQLQETKRAFFGGMFQTWHLFLEISDLPEEDCPAIFDDIEKQISDYWLKEIEVK